MSANDLKLCVSHNSPATLSGGNFDCPGDGSLHSESTAKHGSIKRTDAGLMDDYGNRYNSEFNFIDFDMKKYIDSGKFSGGDIL
jgi:hypothetical protein